MGAHLIDGEFQSDKYPTTPRGKVPLSVTDKSAQDLLWEYAYRRRAIDAEFSDDLKTALRSAGFAPFIDDGVTSDLMVKIGKDVTEAILRVLAVAPRPLLPVIGAGAGAALGIIAAELDKMAGCYDASAARAGADNILLAGLIAARLGIGAEDGIGAAYRDFEALRAAGRAPTR